MSNLPTILTEIDEIETVMATDRPRYNRDYAMQARYRALLEQKVGSSGAILADGDSAPLVPIASQQEFAAVHGTTAGYSDYVRLSRTAADWVFAMPAEDQKAFVAGIEALPDDVTQAMFGEMIASPPMASPSSGTALAAFAEMPEGAALIREWGEASGRNLARVRARLFRVVDAIEARSVDAFLGWLNGLSTNVAIALYRKLAA